MSNQNSVTRHDDLISQAICEQRFSDQVSGCFVIGFLAVYFSSHSFPRMFKTWHQMVKKTPGILHVIVTAEWEFISVDCDLSCFQGLNKAI